jgi:DNA helicase-2/ATP-dependent DNA helicase PcrA
MKHRVSELLARPLRDFGRLEQRWPLICTFHSLCLRILKHFAVQIGLPPNFSIYDSADQTRVLKDAIKTLELSSTNFPPAQVHARISRAKNQLLTAQDYSRDAGDFYDRTVARIYVKYQQLLEQNNALDFDDLLLRTTSAFRAHPDILAQLQERFQYLLIDEYQDTNHAQYILAHALAMKNRNICVVGDPDQSIYAWRGADIKNILDFEHDYADAKIVKLEQNYRSTKTILRIASQLIANNKRRKEKSLWTENDNGGRARLLLCQDEHDEADTIAKELQQLHKNLELDWNSMAIFYRMNALSRVMERALFQAKIPYQIARGVEFYGRKEIKDVLAYLRVIANPNDEVSLDRIANVPPRGIGESTIKQLSVWAVGNGVSLFGAMERVDEVDGLSTRASNGIKNFVKLMNSFRTLASQRSTGFSVRGLMEKVVTQSGLEAALKKVGAEEQQEMANVNELITSAAEYDSQNPEGSLEDYLAQVSLVSDVDKLKDGGGAVTLMTLHAAKGLEFPVVAIIGLEEGCLPHTRARESPEQMEEERRLCFVGITRAQQRLILSKAANRTLRGMRERTVASPFLSELPKDQLEVLDRTRLTSYDDHTHYDQSSSQHGMFHKGQLVKHPTFGQGKILEVSDSYSQTRVVVQFTRVGRKTLIAEYARLEPVG